MKLSSVDSDPVKEDPDRSKLTLLLLNSRLYNVLEDSGLLHGKIGILVCEYPESGPIFGLETEMELFGTSRGELYGRRKTETDSKANRHSEIT